MRKQPLRTDFDYYLNRHYGISHPQFRLLPQSQQVKIHQRWMKGLEVESTLGPIWRVFMAIILLLVLAAIFIQNEKDTNAAVKGHQTIPTGVYTEP